MLTFGPKYFIVLLHKVEIMQQELFEITIPDLEINNMYKYDAELYDLELEESADKYHSKFVGGYEQEKEEAEYWRERYEEADEEE